jgi:hypothetical protein
LRAVLLPLSAADSDRAGSQHSLRLHLHDNDDSGMPAGLLHGHSLGDVPLGTVGTRRDSIRLWLRREREDHRSPLRRFCRALHPRLIGRQFTASATGFGRRWLPTLKQRKSKSRAAELPSESRAAEVATVAWMLSTMVALVCELGWVGARWWLAGHPGEPIGGALAGLMFFSALVVGAVVIVLTPVVLRSRRVLPPRGITFFALVVGAAPLVGLCLRIWG